jgi:hypothetical protein
MRGASQGALSRGALAGGAYGAPPGALRQAAHVGAPPGGPMRGRAYAHRPYGGMGGASRTGPMAHGHVRAHGVRPMNDVRAHTRATAHARAREENMCDRPSRICTIAWQTRDGFRAAGSCEISYVGAGPPLAQIADR